MEYKTLKHQASDGLDTLVRRYLAQGWEPYGYQYSTREIIIDKKTVERKDVPFYYQPMIKKKKLFTWRKNKK